MQGIDKNDKYDIILLRIVLLICKKLPRRLSGA
jgi:hypothetical protein